MYDVFVEQIKEKEVQKKNETDKPQVQIESKPKNFLFYLFDPCGFFVLWECVMKEIWKEIAGFNGKYSINNFGTIYSNVKKRNIKPLANIKGYLYVWLCKKNGYKHGTFFGVARLVLKHFGNGKVKPQVNHKDKNKINNNIENLEWVTCKENVRHAWGISKSHCGKGHAFTKENTIFNKIPNSSKSRRICKKCRRIINRKNYELLKQKKGVNQ